MSHTARIFCLTITFAIVSQYFIQTRVLSQPGAVKAATSRGEKAAKAALPGGQGAAGSSAKTSSPAPKSEHPGAAKLSQELKGEPEQKQMPSKKNGAESPASDKAVKNAGPEGAKNAGPSVAKNAGPNVAKNAVKGATLEKSAPGVEQGTGKNSANTALSKKSAENAGGSAAGSGAHKGTGAKPGEKASLHEGSQTHLQFRDRHSSAHAGHSTGAILVPPPPPDTPTIMPDSLTGLGSFDFMTGELVAQRRKELALQLETESNLLKEKEELVQEKKNRAAQFDSLYNEGVISRRELENAKREADQIDSDVAAQKGKVQTLKQMLASLDSRIKSIHGKKKEAKLPHKGKAPANVASAKGSRKDNSSKDSHKDSSAKDSERDKSGKGSP